MMAEIPVQIAVLVGACVLIFLFYREVVKIRIWIEHLEKEIEYLKREVSKEGS